jgi:hypothetical protein
MDKRTPGATPDAFVVEIDGRVTSEYRDITAALNAGLALRHHDGEHEVRVYGTQRRAEPEFHWWMTLADPTACM